MVNRFSPISLGESIKTVGTDKFILTETTHSPNRLLSQHCHEYPNLSLVLSGSFTECINRKSLECEPQSLIIKPAGESHSNRYGQRGVRCLVIEVLPRWIEWLHPRSKVFEVVDHIQPGALSLFALRIYKEFRRMDSVSMLAIEGLLLEIMAETSRRSTRVLRRRPPHWLEQAKEIIHGHSSENISLGDIAKTVNIHPVHLAREFRKFYGCTLGDYLRGLRIQYACRQLSKSDMPLVEIALAAGFSHQAHFSRLFKRHIGMTPTEFRSLSRITR